MPGIIDPEKGYCKMGGEAATYPVFVDAINTNLEEMYMVCPYDIPRAEITVCRFREDASLIGAYHNLRKGGPDESVFQ